MYDDKSAKNRSSSINEIYDPVNWSYDLHSEQQYFSSEFRLNRLLFIMLYSLEVSINLDEQPSGLVEEDTNQS